MSTTWWTSRASRSAGPGDLRARKAPWSAALMGALVGTLLALILFAPARWLASALRLAGLEQVLLEDARGTVWNGDARLVLAAGGGGTDRATLPSRVSWQLRPGVLGADLRVRTECCLPSPWTLSWRLGWGAWTVQVGDHQSVWPARMLTGLGTPWNTLQADGDLRLNTQGARIQWAQGRLVLEGQAELIVVGMSSRLSTLRPMGSYRLRVLGGTPPRLNLDTVDGALRMSGQGEWVGSRLRFRGLAEATPEHLPALSNLLNIIGRRDGPRAIISLG